LTNDQQPRIRFSEKTGFPRWKQYSTASQLPICTAVMGPILTTLRNRIDPSKTRFHDPIMIHEPVLKPTENAFGSHPCCVVSICYEPIGPFHGGNTGSNPVGDAKE